MGRRKLTEGQPCRYGHPWNRSPDWKRCLTCFPNTIAFQDLPIDEKLERVERGEERRKRFAERKADAAARLREARRRNVAVSREERNRRTRKARDFVLNARKGLARRAGPEDAIASAAQLRALLVQQEGRCALTGLPVDRPQLDHIVPVAAGGGHTIDNLQWVHPMANGAKNSSTDAAFREWLLAAADALRAKLAIAELF